MLYVLSSIHQSFNKQWGIINLTSGHGTKNLAISFTADSYACSGNDVGIGCYGIGIQASKTQVELWSSQAVNVTVSFIVFGK